MFPLCKLVQCHSVKPSDEVGSLSFAIKASPFSHYRIWKYPKYGHSELVRIHTHNRHTTELNSLSVTFPFPEWDEINSIHNLGLGNINIWQGNWCSWLSRAREESAARTESLAGLPLSAVAFSLWKGYQGHCWNTFSFSKSFAVSVSSWIFQD